MTEEKRFWDMTTLEIEEWIGQRGMSSWKEKVREDQAHTGELAQGPNPWAGASLDERRQRIIESLAPDLAEEMQERARSAH